VYIKQEVISLQNYEMKSQGNIGHLDLVKCQLMFLNRRKSMNKSWRVATTCTTCKSFFFFFPLSFPLFLLI